MKYISRYALAAILMVLVSGCELFGEAGSSSDGADPQPATRYFGFKVVHTNMSFKEPLMTGDFRGDVFWKPGERTILGKYPEYTYDQSGKKTVTFELVGRADEFTVEFQSLEGILEIDFSGM